MSTRLWTKCGNLSQAKSARLESMKSANTLLIAMWLLFSPCTYGKTLTAGVARARLMRARDVAREMNNRSLVKKVEATYHQVRRLIARGENGAAEKTISQTEKLVGVGPGGKTMAGLPVAIVTDDVKRKLQLLRPIIAKAMKEKKAEEVKLLVAQSIVLLGPNAGLPDARRAGLKAPVGEITKNEALKLFFAALEREKRRLSPIARAKPVRSWKLRRYAGLIEACVSVWPATKKSVPQKLLLLDELMSGACKILTDLQCAEGHFPFPDLRGKSIRFGEALNKMVKQHPGAIKNGWCLLPEPQGGTQFDTGLCGSALLRAGLLKGNKQWIAAALRAADWAAKQDSVPNFNYNSFSMELLANVTYSSNSNYLERAVEIFKVGVLPGQMESGRWFDPHNARTVYHHINIRAMTALLEALPQGHKERTVVTTSLKSAVQNLTAEFAKVGVTVNCLSTLLRYRKATGETSAQLNSAIDMSAHAILHKCRRGKGVKMGVFPHELAALVHWAEQ